MAGSATERGYTLLEALFAVAILAIVTVIAAPSFSALLSERRVSSSAKAFAAALRKAQAEATARNRNVEVLFTTTEPSPTTVLSATPTAAASAGNWLVRQTAPTDASAYIDGHALASQMPTVVMDATRTVVGFTPLGRPVDLSGGMLLPLADPLVVRFTDRATTRRYCTYLTTGGAIRTCDPIRPAGDVASCVPHLADGAC